MKFMFGLHHPLTCKPWTTLSNLAINWEVNMLLRKSSCVLHSCVFIMRRFFMRLSLMLCRCDAEWWCRWLYNIQTLLPVTFGYSLSSEAVDMRQLSKWKGIETLNREELHGTFQKLLELHNCITAGGAYFEGDESFMCVLSIKVPIRKKNLS